MAAPIKLSNVPPRGISKRTFRILVSILVLLVLGAFIYSYLIGYNLLTPLKNSKLTLGNPSPPTFLFSIYGEGSQGQLKKPMGVTAANNKIYVSDTGNQRIEIFDSRGQFISTFGKQGTGKGEFQFPYGIAVDPSNNIYVADMRSGTVQVFNPQGEFVKYFGEDKPEQGVFKSPTGLYLRDGKLYVAELAPPSIKVFDIASGQKVLEFGKSGKEPGQLSAPNGVTVTSDAIIVSDSVNENIQVFSPTGEFQSKMDGAIEGKNAKTLTSRGVGVDGRGVIYGVSMMGNYIAGFSTKGDYLWTFGQQGAEDDKFFLPNGLFVDNQGRIYVTDQGNSKVSVWEN
jgi:DNA-binding beta-propeller fold protein YncE